jgi:hypothetical protein
MYKIQNLYYITMQISNLLIINNVAASYIVAANGVTSALLFSHFERQRAQRFIKQAYKCNHNSKSIK